MTTSDRAATGAALDATGAPQAWNLRLVGHCPMDGRGDGMHINLKDGYAFFGHMGDYGIGTSIVDVRDPSAPRLVNQLMVPSGIHSHKVQIVGDILLVNYEQLQSTSAAGRPQGLRRLAADRAPRDRLPADVRQGHPPDDLVRGAVRVRDRQRGRLDRPVPDHRRPVRPVEPARGRTLLDAGHARGRRRAVEPAARPLVQAPSCPGARRSGVLRLVGSGPRHPRHRGQEPSQRWSASSTSAPTSAARPTRRCPLPGRDVLVVTDECVHNDCEGSPEAGPDGGHLGRHATRRCVSLFPVPAEADFCARGGRFGPHNVHEMRPGTLSDPNTVHLTYFNGGLRVVDVTDAAAPREIAYFVPEAPPGQARVSS